MVEYWEDERFIEHLEEESEKELLRRRSMRIERLSKVQRDAERLKTMMFPGFALQEEIHDR